MSLLQTHSTHHSRRVSLRQLEVLWRCLDSNKEIASAHNRSMQAKEYARKSWMEIARKINSVGDGVYKDWRGWSKYWVDFKAKLKKRVAAVRAAQAGTGASTEPLNAIEKKYLSIVGENFGLTSSEIGVEPYVEITENGPSYVEFEVQDNSQSSLSNLPQIPHNGTEEKPEHIFVQATSPSIDVQASPSRSSTPSINGTCPSPNHESTPAPVTSGRNIMRRRRRRETKLTHEMAIRAYLESTRKRTDIAIRNSVALEKIARNTHGILVQLERIASRVATIDEQQGNS